MVAIPTITEVVLKNLFVYHHKLVSILKKACYKYTNLFASIIVYEETHCLVYICH